MTQLTQIEQIVATRSQIPEQARSFPLTRLPIVFRGLGRCNQNIICVIAITTRSQNL